MFKAELTGSGLSLTEGLAARAANVVAVGGYDGFNYDELRTAAQALRGARASTPQATRRFRSPTVHGRAPARS